MYIYFTSGTADFMEKVRAKHADEAIFIMHGEGNTVLIQESDKKNRYLQYRANMRCLMQWENYTKRVTSL